ncbi:leucine efflux protein LeuE [Streptomyces sp. H10-C2]|uniref:leucine efflux protein LeuE n=1 Tax=unclassified Streptomyces TaxID=2593676 RepID=UPI0024B9089B|nr:MULTISPECIES: leucine efflux protein LeuE [unclassified Streptomyces]MDJ0343993.1 leucine efflux protein LeuE [Streptomyces sp. PH10-H1]MDJ0373516.1 leucine efflux protein LeuE [Streptomyces sp. H10-C2]
MLGITDLSTYLAGLALIILLPGPNSLYVVSVAARRGPRTGYRAAAGVLCGDAALMTLSACGVASLLQASPVAFTVVKFAGAGYLTWLAAAMMRGAWALWRGRAERKQPAGAEGGAAGGAAQEKAERPFRRALVISLFNPKAILFFVAFFVQFVDPGYPHPALSFLALGAWAQLFSITYLTVLIFSGTYLAATFRRRKRLTAGLSAGAGALFLGFAAKLSLASTG